MTEHDILDAIGEIDPVYLEEARRKPLISNKKRWAFGSLAACLFLFLFIPVAQQLYWLNSEACDYVSESYHECYIYYTEDGEIYRELTGIRGGDSEMFEAWKVKNGIKKFVDPKEVNFSFSESDSGQGYDVILALPASMERYFKNENGALRLEALKQTVVSYRNTEVATLTLVYI